MLNLTTKLIFILLICFVISCTKSNHFISDSVIRASVEKEFEQREAQFPQLNLNLTLQNKKSIPQKEREAFQFLCAFMSLNDLVDKDAAYYLRQIEIAFESQNTFSWGKTIPEDIFRHFVLPPRVNNENLDTARELFFRELKPRIEQLSMYQAALEVNHWCHEKMSYRASDERTSSPLASMLTALGRCGEESVFAVAALRAVCIPARQCYTPRWAHTDDNHAWVEVWIDGKWYFLGACEPEPELNMAWFTQPVKRAMMVNTNVFGPYTGKEEVLLRDKNYTKINLIENYATTKRINAVVYYPNGEKATNATVKFKLYNYAEFYPIAEKKTDINGYASLTTGLGDLLIWATDGEKFGYKKISVADIDTVSISLSTAIPPEEEEDLDISPPIERRQPPPVDDTKAKENALRLQYEDSVRTSYRNTFMSKESSDSLAKNNGLSSDSTWLFIQKSEGNWREISQFIIQHANNKLLFTFLSCLADKDLRDTKANMLSAHLSNIDTQLLTDKKMPYSIFVEGIVATRISNELISDWRRYFKKKFTASEIAEFKKNPELVKQYLVNHISIIEENYSRCPISPEGVFILQHADIHSLNIALVALCRSIGIPSRMNRATRIPQYFANNRWVDVNFKQPKPFTSDNSTLIIENDSNNFVKPEYYTHFTISRLQNGEFSTLDYENNPQVKTFPIKLELESGTYQIITGNRQNDGSVLVKTHVFHLNPNSTKEVKLTLRKPEPDTKKKMRITFLQELLTSENEKFNIQQRMQEHGLVMLFIDPAKEPSRHVMNDLALLKQEFDYWGGNILIVVPQTNLTSAYKPLREGLPIKTAFAIDYNNETLNYIMSNIPLEAEYPVTLLLNKHGELLFHSAGYRIGIGEMILKNIQIDKLR